MELHELVDYIERDISKELGILLTIHMDPLNPDTEEVRRIRAELEEILTEFPEVISYHDFRIVGTKEKENLIFDVVVRVGLNKDQEKILHKTIIQKIRLKHPQFSCIISFDMDYIRG